MELLSELGGTCLAALLSIVVLFLLTKLMGAKQVSQMTMFDYVVGITIGSIAAELATAAGADMLIANGGDMSVIHKIVGGGQYGTFFQAHKDEHFDLKTFLEAHFS